MRLHRVLLAGVGGGLVDFVYACGVGVVTSGSITRPWQGVASGWLGAAARDLGAASVALGVVTHFGIACAMALVFAIAASQVPLLLRRPVASGLGYGLVLYGVMYGVVLPLRFPQAFPRWDGLQSVTDVLSHLGVGVVIALVLSRSEPR